MGGSQEIADAAAAAMFAEDRNAHAMGIIVSAVGPGTATVEMTVAETMANGLDTCHGGVIFMLADTAMGFASNSRGGTNLASKWLALDGWRAASREARSTRNRRSFSRWSRLRRPCWATTI